MDTSQFGQDTGGDDIYFDEQLSEDDSDEGSDKEKGNVAKGNLNRHNNVNTNYLDDITDSDDSGTEEDE